ncbi:MAG: sensor histidine kinase [Bryobacteraceae bacterium]
MFNSKQVRRLGRVFGDLKVRPKLIVLHNVFFLVLTCGVYFAIIPPFEKRVAAAKTIEISLITQIFSEEGPLERLPKIEAYNYLSGSAGELQVPLEAAAWLKVHPGEVWQNPSQSDFLFRQDPENGLYRRITLPNLVYDEVLERAKIALFVVLGLIYVLAVLLLERVIMPLYVYQPLNLMLDADSATLRDERRNELIPEPFIPGDEIGQIMRSRNQTVTKLREHEDSLGQALERLEETAADLKQKNEMLETAKRNLEAQDRLASLGLLSTSVAHELNTPLAVLHGSIEKLLETVRDQPAQERLARMLRVTQRLQKISEGLVDFARVRSGEMEPVVLRPLMEEAWSLVAIDEKAAAAQFINETDSSHTVTGNADRLIQVFVNLLRNSLNAVDAGDGRVCVRSRRFLRDAEPWIAIAVEDNGPGIPADVLPEIFEAFVSSRLDARGTGLGLTVAEGIVQQHGGTILASNRPGGGARLEVTLRSAE